MSVRAFFSLSFSLSFFCSVVKLRAHEMMGPQFGLLSMHQQCAENAWSSLNDFFQLLVASHFFDSLSSSSWSSWLLLLPLLLLLLLVCSFFSAIHICEIGLNFSPYWRLLSMMEEKTTRVKRVEKMHGKRFKMQWNRQNTTQKNCFGKKRRKKQQHRQTAGNKYSTD